MKIGILGPSVPAPTFSVIVPTYGRPAQLRACLAAIARTDWPRNDLEVIAVDDGSPTSVESIAPEFQDRLCLAVVRQRNAGPSAARNAGAALARGRLLAFTDDDCEPSPRWLPALAARIEESPCAAGGCTWNGLSANVYAEASQLLTTQGYLHHNPDPSQATFLATNNFALPAAMFQAIGGFDASFRSAAYEDREFCERLLRRGFTMSYVPEAVVSHRHILSLRTFWRQHFVYGQGAFRFYQPPRERAAARIGGGLPRYYTGLAAAVLKGDHPFSLSLLVTLSQVASAAGWLRERTRV
ncbi:MAG: glycosyltransferase [Bryobacteraceae bacterium]